MGKGVDVSRWQGEMDWAKTKMAGATFAFIRAGSIDNVNGAPYTDFRWEENILEASDHIESLGAYWYFRPNHSPLVQANYLLGLVNGNPLSLGLWVDTEVKGTNQTDRDAAIALLGFVDRLEDGLGSEVGIYTRASFFNVVMAPTLLAARPDFFGRRLWVARYRPIDANDLPDLSGPWSDGKFKVQGWEKWDFWQYSGESRYTGIAPRGFKYGASSTDIDLNLASKLIPPPDIGGALIPFEMARSLVDVLEPQLELV